MHQLTGDFYTVGEVLGHTLAGIGASLGLSMNFEAVTARYVDVRLERKKEVLDAYHSAVEKAAPEKPDKFIFKSLACLVAFIIIHNCYARIIYQIYISYVITYSINIRPPK